MNELRGLLRQPLEAASSSADATFRAAAEVRELVLPPRFERRMLRWRGTTIAGGGLLGFVPFECLPLRDGDALLGEVSAIDSQSSLPLAVQLVRQRGKRGARESGKPRLALLATLQPDAATAAAHGLSGSTGGARLRFPIERDDIQRLLSGYTVETVLDDAFTREAFLGLDLTAHDVVHVLAHGLRTQAELGSGLALADGPLWHADVREQAARGLVVISACSAGRFRPRRGDDPNLTNLGGAFLWQGAEAVVLSDAELRFGDHVPLIASFHAALAGDAVSAAEALRRARRELAGSGASREQRLQAGLLRVFGLGQVGLARR